MKTDYYQLLGISPDADEKAIRKAWRIKTKSVHPDVNKSLDANAEFRELTDAMEILLDTTSRIKHDRHFGYSAKPKNKADHAKQKFSDYQKAKAEKTVNEWSVDYNVAMAMREEQRKKHLAKHQRKMNRIIISTLIGAGIIALLLILFWDHIFVLP